MIVYLDGQFVDHEHAKISVFDRGFIFGDGLYEGLRASGGRVIALGRHLDRLAAGMRECRMEGFDPGDMERVTRELLQRNHLRDAFVYWQVTRGTPTGESPVRARIPIAGQRPTVFAYASALPGVHEYTEPLACSASTVRDTRWLRGHVKSTSLLGNVLGTIEAIEHGADDAVFIRDGLLAEGTSTNVFVALDGVVVTPTLESAPMLGGVTRALLIESAPSIVQRPVTVEELHRAEEIMLVGTISMVRSVTRLDGKPVGDGRVGPSARGLLRALVEAIERDLHSAHA